VNEDHGRPGFSVGAAESQGDQGKSRGRPRGGELFKRTSTQWVRQRNCPAPEHKKRKKSVCVRIRYQQQPHRWEEKEKHSALTIKGARGGGELRFLRGRSARQTADKNWPQREISELPRLRTHESQTPQKGHLYEFKLSSGQPLPKIPHPSRLRLQRES